MSHGASQPNLADCQARSANIEARVSSELSDEERLQLARESFNTGYDANDIGATELAETNFHRVVSLYDSQVPSGPGGPSNPFLLVAGSLNHLGLICLDGQRAADSIQWFGRAIELHRQLQKLTPEDRENQVYLGGVLCNRGHAVAKTDPMEARDFYQQSLLELQQPKRTCECSYWDEARNSWWCERLESLAATTGLAWVGLAPYFIDNAQAGLVSVSDPS